MAFLQSLCRYLPFLIVATILPSDCFQATSLPSFKDRVVRTGSRSSAKSTRHYSKETATTSKNDDGFRTKSGFTVRVVYEGRSCEILVGKDETILAALERHQISDRLSMPTNMIPSDCRRGNCMTCAASICSPRAPNVTVTDDGLSPHMSRLMKEKGYILTCSSHVVGEGLELVLGENHEVWTEFYRRRLEDDQARFMGWAAMARARRKGDERNVPRWKKETESVLKEEKPDQDSK
mmetsp:Transcript_6899/g.10905  ORF Transcript_6899/g.10905 Transcript_6899/m.10905 type:complete len:236 (-) Transcript_6899:1306-2013(-)